MLAQHYRKELLQRKENLFIAESCEQQPQGAYGSGKEPLSRSEDEAGMMFILGDQGEKNGQMGGQRGGSSGSLSKEGTKDPLG